MTQIASCKSILLSGCKVISVARFSKMVDQLTNITFVEEIKKYPILFNNIDPEYNNLREKDKVWEDIGKKVNLTVSECKDRWKNLRTAFCRHLANKTKRSYYLSERLQFIVPFLRKTYEPVQDLEEEEVFIYADAEPDEILSEIPTDIQPSSPSLPQPKSAKHSAKRKRRIDNNSDPDLNEYLNFDMTASSVVKEELDNVQTRREASRMFLLSMLPDLMQMDDHELRKFKKIMLNTVDDILTEKSKRCSSNNRNIT
ncbi:uncharacterized protein LOC111056451 [Nilaparvata lugens]|uniref:uncharacterized protein LOC111056451 n=1 Tax=Nilaparvata lugens TaxID=108931 RepID=UPI00193D25BE|nr:uncharacterized protein LOC111056451 [Nilaparvata lugens]